MGGALTIRTAQRMLKELLWVAAAPGLLGSFRAQGQDSLCPGRGEQSQAALETQKLRSAAAQAAGSESRREEGMAERLQRSSVLTLALRGGKLWVQGLVGA